jgi:Cytochrome P460
MMRYHQCSAVIVVAGVMLAVTIGLAAQRQDRFALTSSNGIAFSEFKGYDAWQLISTSQHDGDDGCGTSTTGCAKAILGNPIMIKAYQGGIPANGKPFPDGAVMAKIEWLKTTNESAPYQITEPGQQTEVAFMVKDSKRFPDTNGWGYATLQYDSQSDSYKLHAGQKNPAFAKELCHACHIAGASKTDYVFTTFARR